MIKLESAVLVLLASAVAAAVVAQEAAAPKVTYFEAAKITVDERARADGFMRVRIIPQNGEAREATIDIQRRMSENDLARGIADALNKVLGADYLADRDAGEHVKIRKKQRDAADFSVEITFNAPGFAVILDN